MRISGMPKGLVGIENLVEPEAMGGDQQLRVDLLWPRAATIKTKTYFLGIGTFASIPFLYRNIRLSAAPASVVGCWTDSMRMPVDAQ
jgi:hypothetical protein